MSANLILLPFRVGPIVLGEWLELAALIHWSDAVHEEDLTVVAN